MRYLTLILALTFGQLVIADEVRKIKIGDPLPYGQSPINYPDEETSDAIAKLKDAVEKGETNLPFSEKHGYLPAVLKALNVPLESQLLVFSKTAVNQKIISPTNPRAIYFNDEVSVAWVPGAAELELTAIDPLKGGMFYLIPQEAAERPEIRRNSRCLACHVGITTLRVPGFMIRSFFTKDDGKPVSGYSRVTHDMPLWKRWGGWYVTGTHGKRPHRGNLIGVDKAESFKDRPLQGGNVDALNEFFPVKDYLAPTSDIVAHLVFDHMMNGFNLIIRVNYEARLKRQSDAEEQLLRYLLFADEPRLDTTISAVGDRGELDASPIRGNDFAQWFSKQSLADGKPDRLRELDLKTRLQRHRVSFLVNHRLFRGLPCAVRDRLMGRMQQALESANADEPLTSHIPISERREILAILKPKKR